MRFLRVAMIAVVGLSVLLLIVSAMLPDDYRFSRTIEINRTVGDVYPLVVNLPNWPKWDPFTESDPDAESTFTGTPGTIGSTWSWEGELIGVGRLTLQEFVTNVSIRSELAFISPQPMVGKDIWEFVETPSGVQVSWISEGNLDYPFGRFAGIFMDSILGPSIETGLDNLKKVSEGLPPPMQKTPADSMDAIMN
ncbi:MAG: SRPBCC family protein [Candidatus Latescibacteria bacterium]|nr:SRPBCC family protein [Candidatus Latescibacterota bacterium]